MADLNLPIPGVTNGPGWAEQLIAAIVAVNDEVEGRLSNEALTQFIADYMAEHPNVDPEVIAQAVADYLDEHPVEGVTQAQLDAAIAAIELTPGPQGVPGADGAQGIQGPQGEAGPKGDKGDKGDTGDAGAPGPSAVSADAGNLAKLGTDNLILVDPADLPSGGGGGDGLSGTGSPEGVHSAPVGTIYTDTAATRGAIRWIKASGTGATGWKVLYGDTGPRSLPLPDGLSSGLITIQRYADEVTVRLQSINNSTASPTTILALPLGWRPLTAPTGIAMVASNAPIGALTVASNWDLTFAAPVGNFRHAILKYQTPDPWPATLPGTAA